jgi:hypothetical protein
MFVLFNIETTRFARIFRNGRWQDAKFATESAAKSGATRMAKKDRSFDISNHAIMEASEFAKIEKTETVYNLLTGLPVVQSVNTPLSCDPSSETYHCM